MPNFTPHPTAKRNYWAHDVAHSFCPPTAGTLLTLFVSTAGHRGAAYAGDIVLAFARGRLVMVTRVVGSGMPPELQVSIELSGNPRDMRCVVGAVEVEVLDVDVEDFYDSDDCELLLPHVQAVLPVRDDPILGDARRFDAAMGSRIADALGLD